MQICMITILYMHVALLTIRMLVKTIMRVSGSNEESSTQAAQRQK